MEDGIEQSMSFLIAELEKKQRTTKPKYEEQVHPIGLSVISVIDTTPISQSETTPIGHQTTPISVIDTTPIGHDNTPIGKQETIDKTLGTTPIQNLQETPSTNTDSDS